MHMYKMNQIKGLSFSHFLRPWCLALTLLLQLRAGGVQAQVMPHHLDAMTTGQECRIVFDMGSSGIRVEVTGAGDRVRMPSRDIDVLTPLIRGKGLDSSLSAVQNALVELPMQAKLPMSCIQLGGGFSAWRLAWQQNSEKLTRQLTALREQTGVAVLIIPAAIEGRYGHDSAQQALGQKLQTSHILDIGGGSMQVAGRDRSFGIEFGQKSWLNHICQSLKRDGDEICQLLPLRPGELQYVRDLADQKLKTLSTEVGSGTLTAISRPVTRGIRSALLSQGMLHGDAILLRELSLTLELLSAYPLPELVGLTQLPMNYANYLVSDMLLVEGVLRAMKLDSLALAEAPINNLPALMQDERAFEWAKAYTCYLQELRQLGPAAYFVDPAKCANPSRP